MMMPAGVLAASVAATTADADVMFHMLHPPELGTSVAKLKQRLDRPGFTIISHAMATGSVADMHVTRQYSEAIYYRFFLPDLLQADRVLYLDSDMMARRSLTALHDSELGGAPVAAARDHALTFHMRDHGMPVIFRGALVPVDEYCADVLQLDLATTAYFNSGTMVMDLQAWRERDIAARCLAFCRRVPGLVMSDQDALNHVLQGAFAPLDPRWNAFAYLYDEYRRPRGRYQPALFGGFERNFRPPRGDWQAVLAAWAEDAWIVHFAFMSKPWNAGHRRTAYDREFWHHARQTPFARQLRRQFQASAVQAAAMVVARWGKSQARTAWHLTRGGLSDMKRGQWKAWPAALRAATESASKKRRNDE